MADCELVVGNYVHVEPLLFENELEKYVCLIIIDILCTPIQIMKPEIRINIK